MALSMTVQAPTGDADRDIGSGVAMTWIEAAIGEAIASRTKLHVNIGFMPTGNPSIGALGINARRGKILTFGGSVTTDASRRLKVGAEIDGATTTTGDPAHQLHALVGGNYDLGHGRTLDAGALVGYFRRTPRIGVLAGITVTIPPSAAPK